MPEAPKSNELPVGDWAGLPPAADVEPMKCGIFYYVHLGKTGGTEVIRDLFKNGPIYGWKSMDYWSTGSPRQPIEYYWEQLLNETTSNPKPKIVVHQHHGAPGLAANFEENLRPLACLMKQKGCGFALATTLREPVARFLSSARMNFIRHTSVVSFANQTSNYQSKALLSGTYPPTQWPGSYRFVRRDDHELYHDRALQLLSHFQLVGQTERLNDFLSRVYALLGIEGLVKQTGHNSPPPVRSARRSGPVVEYKLTTDEKAKIKASTSVDAELYAAFSAKERPAMAAYTKPC